MIHHNMEAYADPPDYDFVVGDAGIPIYTALPQETGGPVLEIGCGTGRVSIPIAQQDFSVTGLDIAPGMLEWHAASPTACPFDGSKAMDARSTSAIASA